MSRIARRRVVAPVLTLVVVLSIGACSGGGGSKSSGSGNPSTQQCLDGVVAALNQLDVSRINPSDGIDDSERSNLDSQASSLEVQHPELASDSPCATAFTQLPQSEQSQVFARIRPEVAAVLGASARSSFSTVANSIN